MAQDLERGSSHYYHNSSPSVSARPFTWGFWGYMESLALWQYALWMGDKDTAVDYWRLGLNNTNNVFSAWRDSGSNRSRASTTAVSGTGVWFHACASYATGDYRVYLDGGGKNTSANDAAPANADKFVIGCQYASATPNSHWDGLIAEIFVANAQWSDAEVAAVASGVSPLEVRPDELVYYSPFIGADYNVGSIGTDVAAVNGPVQAQNHPPLRRLFANYRHPAVCLRPQSASISGIVRNIGSLGQIRIRARKVRGSESVYAIRDGVHLGIRIPPEAR